MMLASLIFAVALAWQANAAIVPIAVGRFGLTFTPNNIIVAEGDVLEFRFWARNHSVVQGTWGQACVPTRSAGFFSGFFPTAEGGPNVSPSTALDDIDTDIIVGKRLPRHRQHCKNGMVGVVNPNSVSANTLDAYITLARNASNATSPNQVFGGTIAQLPVTASVDTSTAATATSTSTSASTTGTSTTTSASATSTTANAAATGGPSFAGLAAAGAAAILLI
ncbi:hypothetical protein OQA88_7146 [Cercophora sp. LCS_1]